MKVIDELENVVGKRNVITSKSRSEKYREGYRSGHGDALAVIRPKTLIELWKVLQIVHQAGLIVIMQAANTGLTG